MPASYSTQIPLPPGYSSTYQFLSVAASAIHHLGWTLFHYAADGITAHTPLSDHSFGETVTLNVQGNMLLFHSICNSRQLVDGGKNRQNIEQLIQVTTALKNRADGIDDGTLTIPAPSLLQQATGNTADKDHWYNIFIPRQGYFITPILVFLNLLVFIVMVSNGVGFLEPTGASLVQWGANYKPYTLNGQLWRLFTCTFVHIGIIHLLMNMYALVFVGILLEPVLGKARFLTAYIATGILASLTSLWWHNEVLISAGASGAIFGMYGVLLAMLTSNVIDKKTRFAQLSSIGIFVAYNLLSGLQAGIDNAAHIGGLISGLLIGYSFYPSMVQPLTRRIYSTIALIAIVTGSITFISARHMPNYLVQYGALIERFNQQEEKAMHFYRLPDTTREDQRHIYLKTVAIPAWNNALEIADSLEHLELPKALKKKMHLLKAYGTARHLSFVYMDKRILEKTPGYDRVLSQTNREIDSLLRMLNQRDTTK